MVPRELLIVLATLTALCVATSAAAAAAVAASPAAAMATSSSESIDFDLTDVDYEVIDDMDKDKSTDDEADVFGRSNPRIGTRHRGSNSAGHHHNSNSKRNREVRCFCNQPHCVSQGYMCRGRGCFTNLPILSFEQASRAELNFRPEHASYSGCLEKSFAERACPQGKLCCEQDLCNHIDNPAMRLRLNKTIQVLMGERRLFPVDSMRETATQEEIPISSDNWFRLATIAIPIFGFVILIVLASLAIRLLQPMPLQGDKLNGLRMPENTPPLLGPPKLPLV